MPMQKIVDGIAYEGKPVPDLWRVSTWEANGVRERSARPVIAWEEIGPVGVGLVDACGFPLEPKPETPEEREERRLASLKRAALRAKQMARRLIITEGFNELLTITYRENQTNRELCKRHFKEWVRRMKAALGGSFRYVAAFERQDRGAMHVHVACHKLPQHAHRKGVKVHGWRLGTEIWRDIVGRDNGLVFVGGRKKDGRYTRKWTLAKMATYVSKYILKDYADAPDETNRYSRSDGIQVGEVHRMELRCSFLDLVAVTFERAEGHVVVSHRVGRWCDSVWLCTEEAALSFG